MSVKKKGPATKKAANPKAQPASVLAPAENEITLQSFNEVIDSVNSLNKLVAGLVSDLDDANETISKLAEKLSKQPTPKGPVSSMATTKKSEPVKLSGKSVPVTFKEKGKTRTANIKLRKPTIYHEGDILFEDQILANKDLMVHLAEGMVNGKSPFVEEDFTV